MTDIGTLAMYHLTLHEMAYNLTIYRDVSHILNMLKMLRRPAIPTDCKNRSRQNRRGSHTTRCPVGDSVAGAIAGRRKLKIV